MCHPEASVPADLPGVSRSEVRIPLATGEQLPAWCCSPQGGSGPPVVLIPDIYGRTPFYTHVAARLAAAGYVALLPDYFFRQDLLGEVTREAAFVRWDRLDELTTLEDLKTVANWTHSLPEAAGTQTGLLGFCLGGTFALDLCAHSKHFSTVCYYAFPNSRSGPNTAPKPRNLVDQLHGPILSFWGDADYIDLDEIRDFSEAASSAGAVYDSIVYSGAGHGFLQGLVESRAESGAANDSWQRTLQFFATNLARLNSP